MMVNHRGLTLVEVLVATVLLAALAGTVVPMLRTRDVDRAQQVQQLVTLDMFADRFLQDHQKLGVEHLADISDELALPLTSIQVEHDLSMEDNTVIVRRMISGQTSSLNHAWLIFVWEGDPSMHVTRWIPLPDREEDAQFMEDAQP